MKTESETNSTDLCCSKLFLKNGVFDLFLNTHISKNMGLSAKEFSVGECFPKGYLHTQNERNWRKKIFWWSIFTFISARMPQRFKEKFLRKSVFHDHFYFQDLKIILY